MKLAVISDVHANAFALEAVLADITKRSVTTLVNLGDIFYGPIAPRKTYDLLMDFEGDVVTICGNQDRQIYEATVAEIAANPTMAMVIEALHGEPMEWMCSLPPELQLNNDVYLCHGAPGNDLSYLLEDIHSGHPVVRADEEIQHFLQGQDASLILCGHSHLPKIVTLGSGQLIVNPGSVGLPAYADDLPVPHSMENYSSHASYAVVEKTDDGWLVEHCSVPYDVAAAVRLCHGLRRSDWAGFITSGRTGSL